MQRVIADLELTFDKELDAQDFHEICGAVAVLGLDSITMQDLDTKSILVSGDDPDALRRILWFVLIVQNRENGAELVRATCNDRIDEETG